MSFAFLAKLAYLFSAFAQDAVFSTSVGGDQIPESSATVHGGALNRQVSALPLIFCRNREQADPWWPAVNTRYKRYHKRKKGKKIIIIYKSGKII